MNKQEIHSRLEELQAQLHQIDSTDANKQETVRRLKSDIQELLDQKEGVGSQHYQSLSERLREDIEQFEASHPQAALMMGQLVDVLANIGI